MLKMTSHTSIVAKISISVNTVVIHFSKKNLPKTRQFMGKSGIIPYDKIHTLKYRNVDFVTLQNSTNGLPQLLHGYIIRREYNSNTPLWFLFVVAE
jgi:hypothetical protein